MAGTGLRDFINAISPPWLATGVAEKYLYGIGLVSDALLEKHNESVKARIPTYGDPSALQTIGSDRLIPRGLIDTDASYAKRLQRAFDDWQIAGSSRAVMRQLLVYLGGFTPRARIVSQNAAWDTFQDGSDTTQPSTHYQASPSNWVWDTLQTPAVVQGWWRSWIILYATAGSGQKTLTVASATNTTPIAITVSRAHGYSTGQCVIVAGVVGNTAANGQWRIIVTGAQSFTLTYSAGSGGYVAAGSVTPTWAAPGPVWGAPGARWGATLDPNLSMGLSIPPSEVASLRAIASTWKGQHAWVRWIMISFDATMYDPSKGLGDATLPDGTWGTWERTASRVSRPSRNANTRFCDGVI